VRDEIENKERADYGHFFLTPSSTNSKNCLKDPSGLPIAPAKQPQFEQSASAKHARSLKSVSKCITPSLQ